MASPPERYWEVIREHQFERDLRDLEGDSRLADAFVEAAEFVLARDPFSGLALTDEVWFMPMAPLGERQVVLYYTFDDSTVWLLSIVGV